VANTTSEAWKFKHLKRKTDRDDALRLAEVYQLGKLPTVTIPAKEVREQRALIEHRQKLVGRRIALQNRIRAILVGQGCRRREASRPGASFAWPASPCTRGRSPTARRRISGVADCS
jgi:transposase